MNNINTKCNLNGLFFYDLAPHTDRDKMYHSIASASGDTDIHFICLRKEVRLQSSYFKK